jgi:hypothetical protein
VEVEQKVKVDAIDAQSSASDESTAAAVFPTSVLPADRDIVGIFPTSSHTLNAETYYTQRGLDKLQWLSKTIQSGIQSTTGHHGKGLEIKQKNPLQTQAETVSIYYKLLTEL